MTTFTLSKKLFGIKEDILILGSAAGKVTGVLGPAGVGTSMYRPTSVRTGAKFNACAKFLDKVFLDKSINALCSDNSIYGEVDDGTYIHRFICSDGKKVTYEGERLHGNAAIIPLVLYALRNASDMKELAEAFSSIKEEVGIMSTASIQNVLLFCDSFYYGAAKDAPDIEVEENSLMLEPVQASVRSGLLVPMKVLEDIRTPALTGVRENPKKKESKKQAAADVYEKIKAGEFVLPYEWDEKQKLKVPTLKTLDDFVPSPVFYSMVNKIKTRLEKVQLRMDGGLEGVDAIGKDYINLFVNGRPGTGKTTAAYALGAATGMPTYTVAMTKNTEEDVFQGMTKVIDGALKFTSTDFLDAYTNGGIIILEEINLPDPSVVMGSIGQAVEFPFILMKDGYQPVRRHPLCVIIGTMNIGTYGSKGVNQALSSRFKQSYTLNDPSKEDFINILMKQGNGKKESAWVFNAYDRIISYLKSPSVNAEDVTLNVSLRGCIGALEDMAEGESPKDAIRNTLIGKISEIDLELADDVYKNVVRTLPEL